MRHSAKINEKAMITSPWTLTSKLFSAQTWSANNNISLNEKNDLYFVDAEMLPMFVQVRQFISLGAQLGD